MGVISLAENMYNCVPIRVYRKEGTLMVDWCYMGDTRFTEPFFDVTVTMKLREGFSLLFRHQTPIDLLSEIAEQSPRVNPTGFIFHMSRCGSTLVSQMLASLEENIVISEAPPIDSILGANNFDPTITGEQRIAWLRGMIGAMGRKRTGNERSYFLKFDSWNTLDLELIESAFPDVPWIFLYRNPIEVMVSQIKKPGSQMIRGAMNRLLPGLPVMEALQMPGEEYCARVLARFCEIALRNSDNEKALFVNYKELPGAVTGRIAEHFGMSFSPSEIETMNSAAKFDAKTPSVPFTPDNRAKQDGANDAIRNAAAIWLDPLYEQLEAVRKKL